MPDFRLFLVVLLVALMDLGAPVLPETPADFDEFNHAAHGRRRLVWVVARVRPAPAVASVLPAVPRPGAHMGQGRPTRLIPAPPRKTPSPPSADASSTPDH